MGQHYISLNWSGGWMLVLNYYINENWFLLGIGGIEHIFTCFVTHGHLDHTLVIPGIVSAYSVYHISFADTITLIMYNKAAQIYVPTEITDFVHSVVQSSMEVGICSLLMMQMNWGEKIDAKKGNFPKPYLCCCLKFIKRYCDREFPYPYDIFPCVPSENHKVDSKHMVSIIKYAHWLAVLYSPRCDHTVPCIGYCFYESRTRLKNEYKGLSKEEMVQLRKKNVEVSEQAKFPLFAFLGNLMDRHFWSILQLFLFSITHWETKQLWCWSGRLLMSTIATWLCRWHNARSVCHKSTTIWIPRNHCWMHIPLWRAHSRICKIQTHALEVPPTICCGQSKMHICTHSLQLEIHGQGSE